MCKQLFLALAVTLLPLTAQANCNPANDATCHPFTRECDPQNDATCNWYDNFHDQEHSRHHHRNEDEDR